MKLFFRFFSLTCLIILLISILTLKTVEIVYAQDGGNNEGNSQNSNDDHPNTCDQVMNSTGDCGGAPPSIQPDWDGHVYNTTGLALTGAQISITCTTGRGSAVTNASGYYYSPPINGITSSCNPVTLVATYNGQTCEQKQVNISGVLARITTNFVCNIPPACGIVCNNPANCQGAQGGCTSCLPAPNGQGSTCQLPPRCGQTCTTPASCQGAEGGCTACVENANGTKTCQTPPRCGQTCTTPASCAGSAEGCTSCLPNPSNPAQKTCQHQPTCGGGCVNPASCVGAENGCTSCLPNLTNPSQTTCQPNPRCGSDCISPASCVGAQNGCTLCIKESTGSASPKCGVCPAGTNYNPTSQKCECPNPAETYPHGECQGEKCAQVNSCGVTECTDDKQCFAEEMCKCDGFDAVTLNYPSNDPFSFQAFAKVEGTDISKATVEGIQFFLSESEPSDPNGGNIIAQSPVIPPTIDSSGNAKVRFGATWNLVPPQIKKGKLYRVFDKISCVPKKKRQVANAVLGLTADQNPLAEPTPNGQNLQLTNLNLVRKGETDNCRFLFFQYNSGL